MLQMHSEAAGAAYVHASLNTTHPRCHEMAEAMLNIAAGCGSADTNQLIAAGFTEAELLEYGAEAAKLANDRAQPTPTAPILDLADMISKAREAAFEHPAIPNGLAVDLAMKDAWGLYCKARKAFVLYPWHLMREMAITELLAYLLLLPLLASERICITRAVENTLRTTPTIRGAK